MHMNVSFFLFLFLYVFFLSNLLDLLILFSFFLFYACISVVFFVLSEILILRFSYFLFLITVTLFTLVDTNTIRILRYQNFKIFPYLLVVLSSDFLIIYLACHRLSILPSYILRGILTYLETYLFISLPFY